jgi:hypothetical protein
VALAYVRDGAALFAADNCSFTEQRTGFAASYLLSVYRENMCVLCPAGEVRADGQIRSR